ncbi:MAG: HAMP domain-containing sensor histidine kinase, partial [Syntrophotaleaceae bacterium]
ITRGGLSEVVTEIGLTRQSGAEKITLQVKSAAVTDHGGVAVGVITLLRDVTRERALDRLKTEFISTAAHELRTPLTAVMGFSELLLSSQRFSLKEQREFLDIIHRKFDLLGKIVDDMVDLARLDSGQMLRIDRVTTDVNQLLESSVLDYRKLFPGHPITYIGPGYPVLLAVDKHKICQAVENLLNNAVSFSAEGAVIEVECKPRDSVVYIEVRDQGVGMTAEQAERAFDKFYRVDASNTAAKGLGLGLSIVRSIVEAHHGEVRLETALGKGTRAVISLPVTETES